MESKDINFDFAIEVSSDEAWRLWTDPKLLESWLTVKAHIDLQANGVYELFWDPANPTENSTLGCKITALKTNQLLGFQWRGPVPFSDIMNVQPFPTWVIITFEAASNSNTIIHLRHSGWGNSAMWEAARKWQLEAWNVAFNELNNFLNQKNRIT